MESSCPTSIGPPRPDHQRRHTRIHVGTCTRAAEVTSDSRQRIRCRTGIVVRMTTAPTLRILAIPGQTLHRLREQGHDDHGNPWAPRTDTEGGSPLRCCLRRSKPDERIVLIAYAPVAGRASGALGGYDETGPVFVHADECEGYVDDGHYPSTVGRHRQVLRAYRADGSIAGGVLLDEADDRDAAARDLLADPDVEFLHSRHVVYGCYLLEIRRA